MNVASGRAKIAWAIQTRAKLYCTSLRPNPGKIGTSLMLSPSEKRLSSGTSAICSGTICSAKTNTNSALRPLKSIHANA